MRLCQLESLIILYGNESLNLHWVFTRQLICFIIIYYYFIPKGATGHGHHRAHWLRPCSERINGTVNNQLQVESWSFLISNHTRGWTNHKMGESWSLYTSTHHIKTNQFINEFISYLIYRYFHLGLSFTTEFIYVTINEEEPSGRPLAFFLRSSIFWQYTWIMSFLTFLDFLGWR